MTDERPSWVWDYPITAEQFRKILEGRLVLGRLDRDWAAVRLLEYAPYEELFRHLGFRVFVEGWPRWQGRIRSRSRRRGLDFLVSWLSSQRLDLLH